MPQSGSDVRKVTRDNCELFDIYTQVLAHRKEYKIDRKRTETDAQMLDQMPFSLPLSIEDLDVCEEFIKNSDKKALLESYINRKLGNKVEPAERASIIVSSLFKDEVFAEIYWAPEKMTQSAKNKKQFKKISSLKVFMDTVCGE